MDLFVTMDLQVMITQAFNMAQSIYFKFKQKAMIGVYHSAPACIAEWEDGLRRNTFFSFNFFKLIWVVLSVFTGGMWSVSSPCRRSETPRMAAYWIPLPDWGCLQHLPLPIILQNNDLKLYVINAVADQGMSRWCDTYLGEVKTVFPPPKHSN